MCAGLVNPAGGLEWYDGQLKFKDAGGGTVAADIPAPTTPKYIGEAALRDSYLKPPTSSPWDSPRAFTGRPPGAPERGRAIGNPR